jgi:hypothetical protein
VGRKQGIGRCGCTGLDPVIRLVHTSNRTSGSAHDEPGDCRCRSPERPPH